MPDAPRAIVIDGKATAAAIRSEIASEVEVLRRAGVVPGLAVVRVGADTASAIYVRNKIKACAEVGIASVERELPETTSTDELLRLLDDWNARDDLDGILVQTPLPRAVDAQRVLQRVAPEKDVDGFGFDNLGRLVAGQPRLVACTPAAVLELLLRHGQRHDWSLSGKHAVVVGRSVTVGKPMALLLLSQDCTVTVCHSRTVGLADLVRQADLVVAAVGSPHLVKGDWIKPGAVVIDVGIHRGHDGKLTGDVEFDVAVTRASAITPVPGGVGPMTIALLLRNTLTACRARRGPTP
jgi:methylenetetrahydrofolate dehydrogenase (NADP+)/methenyltetrahydrofolate cyclohydrolase